MTENLQEKTNEVSREPQPLTSLIPNGPEVQPHHPLMGDLYNVGPDKPLGYLPLRTIRQYGGENPSNVADLSRQRGLSFELVSENESRISSGALYVYDMEALGHLLITHQDTLGRSEWPCEPTDFVKRVINEGVDIRKDPDLYWLIAKAFKDPRLENEETTHYRLSLGSRALNLLASYTRK